VTGSGG